MYLSCFTAIWEYAAFSLVLPLYELTNAIIREDIPCRDDTTAKNAEFCRFTALLLALQLWSCPTSHTTSKIIREFVRGCSLEVVGYPR